MLKDLLIFQLYFGFLPGLFRAGLALSLYALSLALLV